MPYCGAIVRTDFAQPDTSLVVQEVKDVASGKRGAFFAYGDTKLGQGRENAKEFLKAHVEIMNQIDKEIRAHAAEAASKTRLGGSGTRGR